MSCTHMLLTFFSPSFSDPIHPSLRGPEGGRSGTADNAAAGQKIKNHHPPTSFSTTEPFLLSAPRMTIDFLHVPNIRHMWLFQRQTTWCHLCAGAHLLTLTLVLVFFPLHIYMESVVCLCSVLWGVAVPLFERDIKQGRRGTWWLEHDRDGYFLFSYMVISLGSHFSCFLLMENFIIRQKNGTDVRCFYSLLVASSDVGGV